MRRCYPVLRAAGLTLAFGLQLALANAHEFISTEVRKAYVSKLQELHQTTQSAAAPAARALAWFQIGRELDQIRELLNQDIASHGKTQGLETLILVSELNKSATPLQYANASHRYLANLQHYRQAIALDARGKFVSLARFKLLQGQFYDSFTDNPLQGVVQSPQELLEMIQTGEVLYRERNPELDLEEVSFILAIHYLQAAHSLALPKAKALAQFDRVLQDFRQRYGKSLKLLTLEALAQ